MISSKWSPWSELAILRTPSLLYPGGNSENNIPFVGPHRLNREAGSFSEDFHSLQAGLLA